MGKSFMFSPWAEIRSHQFCFEYVCIRNKLIKNVYVPKFHEETLPNFCCKEFIQLWWSGWIRKSKSSHSRFLSLVLPCSWSWLVSAGLKIFTVSMHVLTPVKYQRLDFSFFLGGSETQRLKRGVKPPRWNTWFRMGCSAVWTCDLPL